MKNWGNIIKWVIAVAIGAVLIYFNYINYKYETHLTRDLIAAKITKVEHSKRSGIKYHYKGGWFWAASFMAKDSQLLNVGDSIHKTRHSLLLKTFRQLPNGKYVKHRFFSGH